MSRFEQYRQSYTDNWAKLTVRPQRMVEVEKTLDHGLRNKEIYLEIEADTKVPFWFVLCCHYRESNFNLATYLGNGEPLSRRTRLVPAGRGPFPSFRAGANDALKLEGFVGCVDWSIERVSYRFEGFNGYGYHGRCPSPYLYGGSTAYGPPEARGGKYIADHHFDGNVVDKQLGTLTLLRRLVDRDPSVIFSKPVLGAPVREPDEELADGIAWVQKALNAHYRETLPEDGRLGKRTMMLITRYQHDIDVKPTGLPGGPTISALTRRVAPGMLGATGTPSMPPESLALMKSIYQ